MNPGPNTQRPPFSLPAFLVYSLPVCQTGTLTVGNTRYVDYIDKWKTFFMFLNNQTDLKASYYMREAMAADIN